MSATDLTLTLQANAPDLRIAVMLRDLDQDLRRAGVETRPVETLRVPGARGDAISTAQLALAFLTSGSAVALIGCLRAYFARDHRLVIRIKDASGREVSVDAKNVGSAEVSAAIGALARPG